MTSQEFQHCRSRYRRFAVLGGVVSLAVVAAVCLLMAQLEKDLGAWPSGSWCALNVATFILLGALFVLGIYADSKVITHIGYRCPACKMPFTLGSISRSIQASGRCRCGERIIEQEVQR